MTELSHIVDIPSRYGECTGIVSHHGELIIACKYGILELVYHRDSGGYSLAQLSKDGESEV